jgi:uncharacterized protein (TIGR00369 family)
MTKSPSKEFSFSELGKETLSDEQFVEMYNYTLPPGLRLMHAKMMSAASDRGEVVLSYELDDNWVNIAGFIGGGYIAQALDQAATAAASLVTGKAAPTIEFKVNFLKAARPGTLIATGTVVQIGKSFAFTEAKVIDGNERTLATATVTSQLIAAATLMERR